MVILCLLGGFASAFAFVAYGVTEGFAWFGLLGLYCVGGMAGVLAGGLAAFIFPLYYTTLGGVKVDRRGTSAHQAADGLGSGATN